MSTPSGSTSAPRRVVLLGSTGSIGTQALDIVRAHPERFVVTGLAAGGGRPDLLAQQAAEFGVPTLAVADPAAAPDLRERTGADVLVGPEAAAELAGSGADVVLNAMDGSRGLAPDARRARRGLDAGAGQQGVAGRRRAARDAHGDARPDRPGGLRALRARAVPAGRPRRGGRAPRADGLRRPVPRTIPQRARRRHRRPGAGPPHLGDGAGGDAELVDAGEQGARADRGAPAVRRALRAHRRRRPPAVDDPLDGHLRRRRDARPGQPAGHAHADRAGARLARPPRRREPPGDVRRPDELDVRARRRPTRSPRSTSPAPRAAPGAACPRSTTPRTRRPSPPSSPGAAPGPASTRRSPRCSTTRGSGRPTRAPSPTSSPRRTGPAPGPASASGRCPERCRVGPGAHAGHIAGRLPS